MDVKIIDAANTPIGRLASSVAKRLLKGERIVIINADRAIITGNPSFAKKKYHERRARGNPHHGPFFPTKPADILRRTIRGMVPYKKASGKIALANLRIYPGNAGFENAEAETLQRHIKSRYITLKQLSIELRGA
ncbi:MAG: 50S ribosomal protein L13 [Candidatus Aenigmarchaeota archaeon]|nr:50S ribosomal protein L13 [Candidatus Aenigmarchaeota archaeon]